MTDFKAAFIALYLDVAECEAPEGSQVDDVLINHQTLYNQASGA